MEDLDKKLIDVCEKHSEVCEGFSVYWQYKIAKVFNGEIVIPMNLSRVKGAKAGNIITGEKYETNSFSLAGLVVYCPSCSKQLTNFNDYIEIEDIYNYDKIGFDRVIEIYRNTYHESAEDHSLFNRVAQELLLVNKTVRLHHSLFDEVFQIIKSKHTKVNWREFPLITDGGEIFKLLITDEIEKKIINIKLTFEGRASHKKTPQLLRDVNIPY